MSTDLIQEVRNLRTDLAALAKQISPWIDMAEMQNRYGVCGKTLLAMERRGDIPTRKNGRWRRSEVMAWEERQPA